MDEQNDKLAIAGIEFLDELEPGDIVTGSVLILEVQNVEYPNEDKIVCTAMTNQGIVKNLGLVQYAREFYHHSMMSAFDEGDDY